ADGPTVSGDKRSRQAPVQRRRLDRSLFRPDETAGHQREKLDPDPAWKGLHGRPAAVRLRDGVFRSDVEAGRRGQGEMSDSALRTNQAGIFLSRSKIETPSHAEIEHKMNATK